MDLLVAGLCLESGLPLLTNRSRDFRGIKGLKIVRPETVLT
jgi:predicted nucleic acid-binding protein